MEDAIIVKFADECQGTYRKNDYSNNDATRNVVKYILKSDRRTTYDIYGSLGTSSNNIEEIIEDFQKVRQVYEKDYGCQLKHLIICFKRFPQLPEKKITKLVLKTLRYWSRKYQVVYALHTNTKQVHIHFALNTVSNSGKRLNIRSKDLYKFRQYCNEIWEPYIE